MTQHKKFKPIKIDVVALQKKVEAFENTLPILTPTEERKIARHHAHRKLATEQLATVAALLAETQGRIQHGLTIFDILWGISSAETRLHTLDIPKSWHRGLQIVINRDEKKKRAYKYSYECVEVVLERKAGAWYLVSCQRETCHPGRVRPCGIRWPTDESKLSALKKRVLDRYFPANGCY